MVAVSTLSWEEISAPDFGNPARQAWRQAVAEIADKAKAALPEYNGRVDKAVALVLNGDVELLEGGQAKVASQSNGTTKHVVCNGTCECRDFPKAHNGFCKHRLSVAIHKRATALAKQKLAALDGASNGQATPPTAAAEEGRLTLDLDPPETPQGIPAQHVVLIQGKPFVKFAGLLQMAHERGLVSLTAAWTYNDADLSLAHAVATFQDGRCFEEAGDAAPANTNRKVAVHFRRVALTRAKARALRDALGVELVAVEELADSE